MQYYIDTIEQIKTDDGGLAEYGKREKESGTIEEVGAKFHTKIANVLNDIGEGKKHTYMDIKITNSLGGCIEKYTCGRYEDIDA